MNNFASNSHLDDMRQEMMNLMDDNIRDSVIPVDSNMQFKIIQNRKGEKILSI